MDYSSSREQWRDYGKRLKERRSLVVAGVIGFVVVLYLVFSSPFSSRGAPPDDALYHVVGFKLAPEHIPKLTSAMLALEDQCQRDGQTYVRSIVGGRQDSKEGFDEGRQVVFVVKFASTDDRDYYVDHDPAHSAFKEEIKTYGVEGVTVLDFVSGTF